MRSSEWAGDLPLEFSRSHAVYRNCHHDLARARSLTLDLRNVWTAIAGLNALLQPGFIPLGLRRPTM